MKEIKEEKVIDYKGLYETNIFMKNIKEIEKVSKENDVDTLIALSIWYKDYPEKVDPKEYSRQVKEFKEACIFVGYDFKVIYDALGI